jgi:UPF0755 protein
MKKLALALVLLLALSVIGVAGAYFFLDSQATAAGTGDGAVDFEVPKGANAKTVAVQLESAGLIGDARVFRYVVWRRHGLALKAGKFSLGRTLSPRELADALEKPPLAEEEAFVVVEGWRIRDVDAALVAAGRADRGTYIQAAVASESYKTAFPLPSGSLEGYLYPETYRLPKGKIDPRLLVQEQLKQFSLRVWEPLSAEINKQGRSLHELVTMASMLEREEPTPSNRPLVAGILWKRFDRRIPLGVDATSRYELDEWNNRTAFLQKLRDPSDPYNMRHNAGLPPTAIGAPTQSSFEAALRSQSSEFLYYLHDGEKRLHPSRNAQEHEALRKKYSVY